MRTIEFHVDGLPKGQPRVKAFRRGKHAGVYTPPTADTWKQCVMLAAKPHRTKEPIAAPLGVELRFVMPRPKGHYGSGRNAGTLKADSPHWHTGTPDVDNLAKAVLDAITQVGIWRDDGQICRLMVRKEYSDGQPGCRVRIEEYTN